MAHWCVSGQKGKGTTKLFIFQIHLFLLKLTQLDNNKHLSVTCSNTQRCYVLGCSFRHIYNNNYELLSDIRLLILKSNMSRAQQIQMNLCVMNECVYRVQIFKLGANDLVYSCNRV